MIVPSMNSKELLREVFNDFTIVERKAYYLCESLRRAAVKSKHKHVQKIFDYRSTRYNNWIILVDCYVAISVFRSVVWYLDEFGMNGLRVNSDSKSITHLTPHFLDRYNERYLHQPTLSKLDLLKQFTQENPCEVIMSAPVIDATQNRIFGRFDEGVGLGLKEVFSETRNEITHFKTFISNDMILAGQRDGFNTLGEYFESYEKLLNVNKRRA
jgi:hypothetical protein